MLCQGKLKCHVTNSIDENVFEASPRDVSPIPPLSADTKNVTDSPFISSLESPKSLRQRIMQRQAKTFGELSTSSRKRKPSPQMAQKLTVTTSSTKRNARCIVCGMLWMDTKEEWLQCVACRHWACETCFQTDTCANC